MVERSGLDRPRGDAPGAASALALPGDGEAARLAVLRALTQQPHLSQRALSEALGLSLGKTHYVLHALLDKGQVKVRNFRRSEKKLSYAYVLTPSGIAEKFRLTMRFLARKEAEFEELQKTIAALRLELLREHAVPASAAGEAHQAREAKR
ncbi:MAG: MarR family EPS-associated transcriptional regulator [Burkholderiales bacterium]|nr:MarR family EPS-associated transcriptional regulator [Burkholderiales bacterium]